MRGNMDIDAFDIRNPLGTKGALLYISWRNVLCFLQWPAFRLMVSYVLNIC